MFRAVARVAFTALCLIFSCACFFALVEDIPFHVAFYFMCIEALGRPPIPILTISGFLLVYGLVVLSVILLPKQIADLISTWAADKSQRATFSKDPHEEHLVMCGYIQYSSAKDFLQDVFQEAAYLTKICIVSPGPPSVNLTSMLTLPPYSDYTKICEGSVLDSRDLDRVMGPSAKEMFVFCQVHCADKQMEDHVTCTRVISLKHYCPEALIRCMVLLPHAMNMITHLASWRSTDVIICLEELKLTLMASNCICRGVITLLATLFSGPVSGRSIEQLQAVDSAPWQREYLSCRSNSLYQIALPAVVTGLPFNLAASYLYCFAKILLVAIVRGSDESPCLANPGSGYVVQPGDCGVVIASGARVLDSLTENNEIYEAVLAQRGREAALEHMQATRIHAKAEQQHSELKPDPGQHQPKPSRTPQMELPARSSPELALIRGSGRVQLLRRLLQDHYHGDLESLVQDAHELLPGNPTSPTMALGGLRQSARPRVLICGFVSSLELCVKLLCEAGFCISILASSFPEQAFDSEEFNEHVTFVRGSCLSLMDLERAGLHTVRSAIVLAKDTFLKTGTASIDELVQDTDALLVYKLIKAHAPQVQVTTELVDSSHVLFLENNAVPEALHEDVFACRSFACGEVYSSILASLLMSKLHVLPSTMQLLPELLQKSPHSAAMRLHLVPAHEGYVGKMYSELVVHLTETEDIVPLGLLRPEGEGPDAFHVVLANPRPDLMITDQDQVYVLA